MTYKDRLLAHLGTYRRDVLGVEKPGIYRHNGKDLAYAHILPKEHQWLGIPEEVRGQVQAYVTA